MQELLIHLRTMQLFYHNAHNLCKGSLFFADHAAFGDFYAAAEADYDSVAERMIGKGQTIDLLSVIKGVYTKCKTLPAGEASTEQLFSAGQRLEQELCAIVQKLIPASSEGTKQMIGNIADMSEMRQYKLKQRLKTSPTPITER